MPFSLGNKLFKICQQAQEVFNFVFFSAANLHWSFQHYFSSTYIVSNTCGKAHNLTHPASPRQDFGFFLVWQSFSETFSFADRIFWYFYLLLTKLTHPPLSPPCLALPGCTMTIGQDDRAPNWTMGGGWRWRCNPKLMLFTWNKSWVVKPPTHSCVGGKRRSEVLF